MTLEEALTHSLNVPFVELIKRYGVERFIGRLQHTGLEWIDPVPAFYGLSAALGTIPLSLLGDRALRAGPQINVRVARAR